MIGKRIEKKNINYQEYAKVAEWCNKNDATIVDKGEYYEVENVVVPKKMQISCEIADLETYLKDTDYMVIKCMERGLSMEQEYPQDYIRRQEARARINALRENL